MSQKVTPGSNRGKVRVIKNGQMKYRANNKNKLEAAVNHPKILSRKSKSSSTKDRNILEGELKNRIIQFLSEKQDPQKTLAIAKACNYNTSKEINPTIYDLLRQGTVEKYNPSPPLWKLSSKSRPQSSPKQLEYTKTEKEVINSSFRSPVKAEMFYCIDRSGNLYNHRAERFASRSGKDSMEDSNIAFMFRDTKDDHTAPGAYVPRDAEKKNLVEHTVPSEEKRPKYNSWREQRGRGRGQCWGQVRGHGRGRGVFNNHYRTRGQISKNYHYHQSPRKGSGNHREHPTSPHKQFTPGQNDAITVSSCAKDVDVSFPAREDSSPAFLGTENVKVKLFDEEEDQDSYMESSDEDSEDEDNWKETRLKGMKEMMSTANDLIFQMQNINDSSMSDSEATDKEEFWEEGLPAPKSLGEEILYKIVHALKSVPSNTLSLDSLVLETKLSQDSFKTSFAICKDKGLVTMDSGSVKLTEIGKTYLSNRFPPVELSVWDEESHSGQDSSLSSPSDTIDINASSSSVEKSLPSPNSLSPASPIPHHQQLPPVVRDYVKSSPDPESKFDVKPSGPPPSPQTLLQKSSTFKMGDGLQGWGKGRGRGLLSLIQSTRPGGQFLDDAINTSQFSKASHHLPLSPSFCPSSSPLPSSASDSSLSKSGQEATRAPLNYKLMPWLLPSPVTPPVLPPSDSSASQGNSLPLPPPASAQMSHTSLDSSEKIVKRVSNALPGFVLKSEQIGKSKPILQHAKDDVLLQGCTHLSLCEDRKLSADNKKGDPAQGNTEGNLGPPLAKTLPLPPPHLRLTTARRPPLLETPTAQMAPVAHAPISSGPVAPSKKPLLPLMPGPRDIPSAGPKPFPQSSSGSLQINSESFAALNKNPISAFMEYAQSRKMSAQIEVLSQRGPPHKPVFLIAAFLDNRRFPGITCHNKKDGRKDAAEQAIRILIAEGEYQTKEELNVMNLPESSMTHFDKMAALTHQKFNQLIAQIPESFTGRKVIAGLILKTSPKDVGSVIAIGSGNRCITGDKLSLKGNTVNDCHAEIITRRGFMRFLYAQLLSYSDYADHPIFERSHTGKLKVKDEVSFHLYISTAPCGDGALFSPRDVESNTGAVAEPGAAHKPTFSTPVQGVLRTKMEGGEGTIPINPADTVQTWDGIVRGERLRTMSCSDKICRWNVLGLQGALLSHFLDTVYLESLTLGFLYDHGHLSRAVCCRLDRGNSTFKHELPRGYRLNHPSLGRVTACDPPRETQKTKSYSVNWSASEDKPELLDGSSGHCHTGIEKTMFSRLTKNCLYTLFKSTCHHFGRKDLLEFPSYYEAKQRSKDFTAAKNTLMKQFVKSKCGKWVSKPIEEEMFDL